MRAAGDPGVRYHLAVALARLDRVAEARDHLRAALLAGGAFAERSEAQALLQSLESR